MALAVSQSDRRDCIEHFDCRPKLDLQDGSQVILQNEDVDHILETPVDGENVHIGYGSCNILLETIDRCCRFSSAASQSDRRNCIEYFDCRTKLDLQDGSQVILQNGDVDHTWIL